MVLYLTTMARDIHGAYTGPDLDTLSRGGWNTLLVTYKGGGDDYRG